MTPPAPALAGAVFGDRLPLAVSYAGWLAGDGVLRGLIGPREVDRLWERHLVNGALLTDLVPEAVRVVDVGSGAGLPGIPMAVRRPDLRLDLVEPMQRRVDFLEEVVADLGLGKSVRVVRGRAEDASVRSAVGNADWVVARAVAPLDRLVKWCLPLLAPHGHLLALKGRRAAAEVAEHRLALERWGIGGLEVRQLTADGESEPTFVVDAERDGKRPARQKGMR